MFQLNQIQSLPGRLWQHLFGRQNRRAASVFNAGTGKNEGSKDKAGKKAAAQTGTPKMEKADTRALPVRRADALIEVVNDGVIVVDQLDKVSWLNKAAKSFLEAHNDNLIGKPIARVLADTVYDRDGIYWRKSKSGRTDAFHMTKQSVAWAAGGGKSSDALVYLITDITERTKLRRDALHHATHDPLTGFTSRSTLAKHIDLAIARGSRSRDGFAILMVDIDRFHLINDTYGPTSGDMVLVEVGQRIQSAARADDLIVRYGNDAFLIIMERLQDRSDASILAEKILLSIKHPLQVGNDHLTITASCGISVWPNDSTCGTMLVSNAELALRKVKMRGNDYQFFSPELEANAKQERLIRQELRTAVLEGQFTLHFQPQIALGTGEVNGFEALIRWPRDGQDMIPPDIFIPIAESAGLIEAITEWVARSAIHHSKNWKREGLGNLGMSINVSARHFVHANLAEDLARVLADEAGADVELTVEVTESMLMSEPKRAVAILERLKSMGVKIAIDDFGTGYSSLAYLKEFPIDSLKIDRTFISQIGADRKQNEIVTAIAQLAQGLGLRIVAEGVETSAQASFLASLGCQDAQGYFYSKPVPANAVPDVLSGLLSHERILNSVSLD